MLGGHGSSPPLEIPVQNKDETEDPQNWLARTESVNCVQLRYTSTQKVKDNQKEA